MCGLVHVCVSLEGCRAGGIWMQGGTEEQIMIAFYYLFFIRSMGSWKNCVLGVATVGLTNDYIYLCLQVGSCEHTGMDMTVHILYVYLPFYMGSPMLYFA